MCVAAHTCESPSRNAAVCGSIRSAMSASKVMDMRARSHAVSPVDTGNPKVQVAILSERIKELTEHMKSHQKDFHTRRGLLMLVGRRRRLLSYIKKNDIVEYRELIKALGIRDNIQ